METRAALRKFENVLADFEKTLEQSRAARLALFLSIAELEKTLADSPLLAVLPPPSPLAKLADELIQLGGVAHDSG